MTAQTGKGQHTAERWIIEEDAEGGYNVLTAEGRAGEGIIATNIERENVARRIAAMPALLEALRHNWQTVHRAYHVGDLADCTIETCQRACTAIRFAEGDEQ